MQVLGICSIRHGGFPLGSEHLYDLLCSSVRKIRPCSISAGISTAWEEGKVREQGYTCVLLALLRAAQKGRIYRFHYSVRIRCQENYQTDGS